MHASIERLFGRMGCVAGSFCSKIKFIYRTHMPLTAQTSPSWKSNAKPT